ncbi:antitoxin [Aeromicrobium massiliense]|uniref:antitoxin n=1 Tax=Aeromicrobium massiliense TaxID=1464554 RepID=UPI000675ED03|nr:antitoxin [Aeromicrobium massiliense]
MGLFGKLARHAPELKRKAAEAAATHNDKIDGAIDKAAQAADRATKGKHGTRITGAAGKAKDGVDKLGQQHRGDGPDGRVAPR